jgi:methylmalonyl-CoA mutase N-terminal domain/subunit
MGSDGTMTAGILRGIEDGWFTGEIAEAAFQYQHQLEKGEKKVVGVNSHESVGEPELEILRISGEVETEQVRALGTRKAARDEGAVRSALAAMLAAARGSANLVPPMLDAVRAEATLGEICGTLRDEWGAYTEPPRF